MCRTFSLCLLSLLAFAEEETQAHTICLFNANIEYSSIANISFYLYFYLGTRYSFLLLSDNSRCTVCLQVLCLSMLHLLQCRFDNIRIPNSVRVIASIIALQLLHLTLSLTFGPLSLSVSIHSASQSALFCVYFFKSACLFLDCDVHKCLQLDDEKIEICWSSQHTKCPPFLVWDAFCAIINLCATTGRNLAEYCLCLYLLGKFSDSPLLYFAFCTQSAVHGDKPSGKWLLHFLFPLFQSFKLDFLLFFAAAPGACYRVMATELANFSHFHVVWSLYELWYAL